MLNFIENWAVQKKVSSVEVSHTIWTKPNDEETWIQQLRKPCFGHAPCRCSRPFSSIFQRYLPTEIDTWTEKRYKFSDFFFLTLASNFSAVAIFEKFVEQLINVWIGLHSSSLVLNILWWTIDLIEALIHSNWTKLESLLDYWCISCCEYIKHQLFWYFRTGIASWR